MDNLGSAVVDPSSGRMGRFSESSEVGLTMMSPSRKPTQKAILEDDDGLNEDVSSKNILKIRFMVLHILALFSWLPCKSNTCSRTAARKNLEAS